MQEGRGYAYRERADTPEDLVRPVELIKDGLPGSQKAKLYWLDREYEGPEEWVPKVRLGAYREEKEALLKDERRMFAALETSGDVYNTTTYRVPFLTGVGREQDRTRRYPEARKALRNRP